MTTTVINGLDEAGQRISSMNFEKMIREASKSSTNITLKSYGQHNIGIRLRHDDGLKITVDGPSGQRLGCMGQPGTSIVCNDGTSDDVGWMNIGAEITVLGNATNGACNAMAAGKVYIAGSIGARGLTMTKWNPEYERPELWVLGSAGDSFAEFNCGGLAVVCGHEAQNSANVLGYRPCVGMVGGLIYVRGQIDDSYSKTNAKVNQLDDDQWQWLQDNMPNYLTKIGKDSLLDELLNRDDWQVLSPVSPQERALMWAGPMPMAEFKNNHWNKTFGGDPIRDLAPGLDRSNIEIIPTGNLRRKQPFWANKESAAPCTYHCPIHIPTVERLRLLREGKTDEAYELLLKYTPLPASVCGAVCPNLCVQNCSRKGVDEKVDTQILGRAAGRFAAPKPAAPTGQKVAIIGGGPGGMNAAWQLALAGTETHIFEADDKLGGKLAQVIPWERLPQATWQYEIDRFTSLDGINVHLNSPMTKEKFTELEKEYDYVIIAVGTHEPRRIKFPGHEKVAPALDFLKAAKSSKAPPKVGDEVVIIGAGNVGCDVACEAYRLGAKKVTLVDIQKPLAFGKEKEAAEALGATFRWPIFTKEVTDQGLISNDGELIPADKVIISIGDIPALSFLPEDIETMNVGGADWLTTNEAYLTSNSKVLAVGDVKRPGLATNALGAGKIAAEYIIATSKNEEWHGFDKPLIPQSSLTLTHYAPTSDEHTETSQADRCLSCASCRDCHLCETICPEGAIKRVDLEDGSYKYASDDKKCIACGFCSDTCPCGIWVMQPF
ncbi:MAG: FAD-dependent oxidoreductase [Desulfotalea sp.]